MMMTDNEQIELVELSDIQVSQSLAYYEGIIGRGLKTFIEVGNALLAIRDGRLYRDDYLTFEDYCRERWGMSRSRAHRVIDAAIVWDNLLPIGNKLPANECQVRPLTRLKEPQAQREAWSRAVDVYEIPTGEQVKEIVLEMMCKSNPRIISLPAVRSPRLIVGFAEDMHFLNDGSIDLIITSPPYNLGSDSWPMGGNGRQRRENGIGYDDAMPEGKYQRWQIDCLNEMYRVAKYGASLFYNHKVRSSKGRIIHPITWIGKSLWVIRQEIVWDRKSTHNHSPSLFWPEDERIYWMTKGKPILPNRSIGMSTVWRFHGPVVNTWHPAPFDEMLPRKCIQAVGRDGITVLDPFAGSCTTLKVALEYGYDAIGVDLSAEYLRQARIENGWMNESES